MEIQPYMVPLLAMALVTAVGLVAISRVHREVSVSESPDVDGLKVFALGFAGSGKTALLAAMFDASSRADAHGISVRVDPERSGHRDQRDRLNDLARRFEDLEAVLPDPNPPGVVERYGFVFDVAGGLDRRHVQPLRFQYVDYSGRSLRDGHRAPGLPEVLDAELAGADVVLCVLDGAKVAALMRSGTDRVALQELRDLFSLLRPYEDKVISFVLTKWDVLVSDGRSLGQVVEWLEQRISAFHDLRHAHRLSAVRVIPTSAFGVDGFMAAGGDGQVRRDLSRAWRPYQVELPIACAVDDVVRHGLRRLAGPAGSATAFASTAVSPFFAWVVKVLGLVTVSTDTNGNINFALSANALERYQAMTSGSTAQPPEGHDDSRSLQLVLRHCHSLVEKLDQDFSANRPR